MGGDPLRELTAVETVGAVDREPVQRVRELGTAKSSPTSQRATRPIQRVSLGGVAQQRIEDPVEERLRLVEHDAVAREPIAAGASRSAHGTMPQRR